jgi:PEP-CTERM motif
VFSHRNCQDSLCGKLRGDRGRLRRVAIVCGIVALALSEVICDGAVIAPATSVPISDPNSVFDVSNPGNNYNLNAPTTMIADGMDIRDLFGGSFGTNGWELNNVIFDNNQPQGTVDSVTVSLASPVAIKTFDLYLEDDGTNGNRSASEFLLFAGNTLIDDVPILDNTGTQSYTSLYGSNMIEISDNLSDIPASDNYTLELVQNQLPGSDSGVRAMEFEAEVPEPANIGLVGMVAMGLLLRRRREAPAVC